MTPERDLELRTRYPLVFPAPLLNDEPIRCGDGWFHLLDYLCRDLQRVIEALPEDLRAPCRAHQVKEKFGTLQFYTRAPFDSKVSRLTQHAEWASAIICEHCGKPGTLSQGFAWVRTLCPEHHAEREAAKGPVGKP